MDSHSDGRRLARRDWLTAGAIFVLALAVRLVFLFSGPDPGAPHTIWLEGDAPLWVQYAAAIDRREPFELNVPVHAPAVAYALAWSYPGVREAGFTAIKIAWCALSAAGCALLYLSCRHLGRRVAVVAAILCTFSFGQYVLATSLNSEAPYTLLLCAMALVTRPLSSGGSLWWAAGLGALHGLANLLRPEHTLLVLLWAAWLALRPSLAAHVRNRSPAQPAKQASALARSMRRGIARPVYAAGIMLASFLLTCLPWSARASLNVVRFNTVVNGPLAFELSPVAWTDQARQRLQQLPAFAQVENLAFISNMARRQNLVYIEASDVDRILLEQFGTIPEPLSPWVLVSSQGPLSFALANHPQADGGFSRAALEHPVMGRDPAFSFSFPPHVKLFNHGYRIGRRYIAQDPLHWTGLAMKKLRRFADGATQGFTAMNLPLGREGVREPVDMLAVHGPVAAAWQVVMLAMFALGAVIACARRVAGIWLIIIAYKIIVTILFYGYARQGASIAPAFFLLMALAVDWLVLAAKRRAAWLRNIQPWLLGACVTLALASDALNFISPAKFVAEGERIPQPQWGTEAFQSFGRIEIHRR